MALRPVWKGGISFGLVYIPVRLFTAVSHKRVDLDLIRESDQCPIKYVRVCKEDGKEVPWEDIAKGYEYEKGDYIVLTDEDFEQSRMEKTDTIDIVQFMEQDEVDPKFLEKPYYVEPEKKAAKTYALLREALRKSGKVGLARYVLRQKEHIGILTQQDNMIILNQMRFYDELRQPDEVDVPDGNKPAKKEVDMALKIIDQLTEPFKPEAHKDHYKENLEKIIDDKLGKKPKKKKKSKQPKATATKDLMAQLKASLAAMKN